MKIETQTKVQRLEPWVEINEKGGRTRGHKKLNFYLSIFRNLLLNQFYLFPCLNHELKSFLNFSLRKVDETFTCACQNIKKEFKDYPHETCHINLQLQLCINV